MLAYGAPGYVEKAGDLPRGELGMSDEPQDGSAPGLDERVQRLVHLVLGWLGEGCGRAMIHRSVPYR